AGEVLGRQPPRRHRRRHLQGRRREDGRGRGFGHAEEVAHGGAMLEVKNIEVIYDDVFLVLRGLSLEVPAGKVGAPLGANGAGKSTRLKAISGLLPTEHGEVTDGAVHFDGAAITRLDAAARVKLGISLVMEGRRVFEHLTVHDNLVAGGYARRVTSAD